MTDDTRTTTHDIVVDGKQERVRWRTGLLALMLALAVGLTLGGAVAGAEDVDQKAAQPQLPKTDLKSGTITTKAEHSVEINGQNYTFQKNIVFADDEGEWREWTDFKRRDQVHYHLKQGQIDYLILVLPK